ncbi:S-DNA-T family DNA segregation ATPase FtsK/SpoIIIE [Streptacidiphilus sp. BW17]|uniref:FtsK/SpoIIIE domain-containing protein n=1 Tax=Streptacidiphilus sp. BW17 TaxID=3156274 RepID=UPI003513B138
MNQPGHDLIRPSEADPDPSTDPTGGEVVDLGRARAARTTPRPDTDPATDRPPYESDDPDPFESADGSVYLPADPAPTGAPDASADLAPRVVEGTVTTVRTAAATARARLAVPPRLARAGSAVRWLSTHERTLRVVRFGVRHTMFTAGGALGLARRAWESRTTAMHQRMIKAAELAGNPVLAAEWQERADKFRQDRHTRRMALITSFPRLAVNAVVAPVLLEFGLLGLGIMMAIAEHKLSNVIAPTMAVIELVHMLYRVVALVWGPVLAFGPWLMLAALWNIGRRRGTAPAWAMLAEDPDVRDVVPDEGAILDALRHLNLAPLNRAVKDGWQPRWVSPTVRLGNGYHTQLQLPQGVTVEMVNNRKTVLAHNLLRLPIEVWPTEPANQPGVLDLWVADQGSLSGPIPPWPLLTDGEADYFKGVPVGVSQRGEIVYGKLMASNYLVGGIMGSGKSSLVINLLLGAALDPLVEIEAYVMAYNVDYDPLRPRMKTLVKGDDDEQIKAARDALRALRDEVTERGKILEELGGEEVRLTRKLAEQDPRMRPKVVVFDECHELFEHKECGQESGELAIKVIKKARKVGITLIFVTVSPTASSIPKDVTRNTSHNVAFAVGDHVANDGLLGTGKHRAGITATNLNPAENVGTAVTVGFTKNAFELIRSYWVRRDAKVDQVTPVVRRSLGLREGLAPAADSVPAPAVVDEVADIAAVLGEVARMRTQEVIQHLAEANRPYYGGWTFQTLTEVLEAVGAAPYKSGGQMVVSRARVLEALADRDEAAEDAAESDAV